VTRLEVIAVVWVGALLCACQSSGSTRVEERPLPAVTPENAGGQPALPTAPAATAAPEPEPEPELPAALVDRVFDLARDWNVEAAVSRIERVLEVQLSEDEKRWAGTSKRWPMVVAYHPARPDRRGALHLSFTDITETTLAELTRRFGAPTTQVKAKESVAAFAGPSGTRVVAGLLGGLTPTSTVAWLRVEEPGPRPPPPKDLFY
jgi:hypothetical protein